MLAPERNIAPVQLAMIMDDALHAQRVAQRAQHAKIVTAKMAAIAERNKQATAATTVTVATASASSSVIIAT